VQFANVNSYAHAKSVVILLNGPAAPA
jgi:hypothetical protein